MISPDQAVAALRRALGRHRITQGEDVDLGRARSRVLAAALRGRVDHPPCAMSAMDGYAVRSADIRGAPLWLDVVGENAAGGREAGRIGTGQAVRIFTGAPLPAGADTIVIEEETRRRQGRVWIGVSAPKGRFVRPRGHDFRAGRACLGPGIVLQPRHIALAAAMNLPKVPVWRRARVALAALGDELVPVGEDPSSPSQIVASSLPALRSMIESPAVDVSNLGIIGDDDRAIRQALGRASAVDLIVTTGGASIGRHDRMRRLLARGSRGVRRIFDTVAMQPGKPTIFALYRGTPILALPGNPVSTMVCGWFFLRPALATILSLRPRPRVEPAARLTRALPAVGPRTQFLRAAVVGRQGSALLVEPFANQDSGAVSILAGSDVLIRREALAPPARKGARVTIVTPTPLLEG